MVWRRDPETAQQLAVLGSEHKTQPHFWYFKMGKICFEAWLEATKNQADRRLLVVEGLQLANSLFGATEKGSIERYYGEVGLLNFWGNAHDIPVVSSEPPHYRDVLLILEEAERLVEVMDMYGNVELEKQYSFTPEDVFWYYGSREIPLWYRMSGSKPSLEEFMQWTMGNYCRLLPAAAAKEGKIFAYDFSYDAYKELHKERLGFYPSESPDTIEPKTGKDLHTFYRQLTCAYSLDDFEYSPINLVSKRCLEIRYSTFMAKMWSIWREGHSPFVWKGMYHTWAIKNIFSSMGQPDDARMQDLIATQAYTLWNDHHSTACLIGPKRIGILEESMLLDADGVPVLFSSR